MNNESIKNKCTYTKMKLAEGERFMPKTKSEFEYLLSMHDLGKYVGKWIAVVDGKIVSTADSGKEVLKESRDKCPERAPLILKVPTHSVMLL